jgi:threonine dehydrogenase-like Zn-dependent dehydrogenase
MKALALTGREQIELIDWPEDAGALGDNEVTGKTVVSLVSPGTELHYYTEQHETPALSGYAAVFQVYETGRAVTDLRPGDLAFCMGYHTARQRKPRAQVLPLNPRLLPDVAVWCRLMAVSWTTLVTTAARPPDRVLVSGLGPVGNLAAQIFRSAGYAVVAVDPIESRRAVAERVGLPDVRPDVAIDDREFAGSLSLVVECSGHEQAVLDACKVVRRGGEVALIGVPWVRQSELTAHDLLWQVFHHYVVLRSGWEWELPLQPREFVTGSFFANLEAAMLWLAEGRVKVEGLYQKVRPQDAQQAWQDLLHRRGDHLTIEFDWRGIE